MKANLLVVLILFISPTLLNSCGPLLGQPPDDTEPTEVDLYGEENTITVTIQGQMGNSTVIPTNSMFKHITYAATDSIPRHSILSGGGRIPDNNISFKIIQDGDEVGTGGFDGVSSLFSLDGLVYFDLEINGERYNSLVYGIGAGGTTVYYNSWFTIKEIHTISYQQPPGERKVMLLKGQFKAILKPYDSPDDNAKIIIDGKIHYIAPEG